jgi:hypothetical protein
MLKGCGLMKFNIQRYTDEFSNIWDDFIEAESMNGTFLQSRRFLSYHSPERFIDHSLIIYKGNAIAALVPAIEENVCGEKIFFSHKGSTFGGIILNKSYYDIGNIEAIINQLELYIKYTGFSKIVFKNTPNVFCRKNTDLIDYFLFKNGFTCLNDLNFYIDYTEYNEDLASNFTSNKRRDFKKSLDNNLQFQRLETNDELKDFYNILVMNLKKYNKNPVHSLVELIDFKENRLAKEIDFYGVKYDNKLVAGSMIFKFHHTVFHTQYLAANPEYLRLFPMNYLNYQLIRTAKEEQYKYFSFGISTEENGKFLNNSLASFKEGFGTSYSLNKIYEKDIVL